MSPSTRMPAKLTNYYETCLMSLSRPVLSNMLFTLLTCPFTQPRRTYFHPLCRTYTHCLHLWYPFPPSVFQTSSASSIAPPPSSTAAGCVSATATTWSVWRQPCAATGSTRRRCGLRWRRRPRRRAGRPRGAPTRHTGATTQRMLTRERLVRTVLRLTDAADVRPERTRQCLRTILLR